jgi:hypothetical protein
MQEARERCLQEEEDDDDDEDEGDDEEEETWRFREHIDEFTEMGTDS